MLGEHCGRRKILNKQGNLAEISLGKKSLYAKCRRSSCTLWFCFTVNAPHPTPLVTL